MFSFLFCHSSVFDFLWKFLIKIFFWKKKCRIINIYFSQKCRCLHKVYNKNLNFDVFYFSILQFLKVSSKIFYLASFFGKKKCFSYNNLFQNCRFSQTVFNKNLGFSFSNFSFFSFWSLFCKIYNFFMFVGKKRCFTNIIFFEKHRTLVNIFQKNWKSDIFGSNYLSKTTMVFQKKWLNWKIYIKKTSKTKNISIYFFVKSNM